MSDAAAGKVIDGKTFWRAIGVRAVGAAICAARDANGPAGFLALSAAHVSADPPLMLVSVAQKTSALAPILASQHFAISYLAKGQESLVDIFSGKGDLKGADRFAADAWTTLTTGAPVLRDGVGALDCVLEEAIERHGTMIMLGRLVDFSADATREPLVSFGGTLR